MNKRKVSLTRALAEVKLLESKLESKSNTIQGFETICRKVTLDNLSQDEFIKQAESELQSFEALFNNRLKLKALIAKANTETTIKFQDKDVTIIELIDLKTASNYKIVLYKNLLKQFDNKVKQREEALNRINAEVSVQVQSAMQSKSNTSKDLVDNLTNTYVEMRGLTVVGLDENTIKTKLQELEDSILDIDMTLSEINAKTEIELDF